MVPLALIGSLITVFIVLVLVVAIIAVLGMLTGRFWHRP